MKQYETDKIRNLALVGHSGSGKTTLTEALLYLTKAKDRMGKVEDGNTVSDFSKEEKARQISINTSVVPVETDKVKINLIDAPGYFDFESEVNRALRASESALVVIDASSGIEVGTEKYWEYTEKIELPRIIFINKMDKENVNFNKIVSDLHRQFGKKVIPLVLPIGEGENFEGIIDVVDKKAYKYDGFKAEEIEVPEIRDKEIDEVFEKIKEVVAESNDELLEKYFMEEEFTDQEIREGMTTAMLEGRAVPLVIGSAINGQGIDLLIEVIEKYMPAPNNEKAHLGFRVEEGEERKVSVDEPFSAAVFKTLSDPFVGKISIFKVMSGKISKSDGVYNSSRDESGKPGGLFILRGNEQIPTDQVIAGDIGAFTKLENTKTGDTLCDKNNKVIYKRPKYQKPNYTIAIVGESKNDDDKIGPSLNKILEEDPSIQTYRNSDTNQLTISGLGNVQLDIVREKLENTYSVNTQVIPLRISYKETIKGKSDVQGRHKKQSGGAGQYGDVFIRFEPTDEDFIFEEEVFGGAVPKNYFPAIEKSLEENMREGVLAGYPMTGVKATLYDGSYHPVDSNEMAFKMAASIAFKKGIKEANPILLEPIMKVEVIIPDEYLGDIMGDMNKRRGRILGMDQIEGGKQKVSAEAPHSELFNYAIDLRSMTQGRGMFSMELERYDEVPSNVAEKVIEEANKED
mgnify:CR=1 FL=1